MSLFLSVKYIILSFIRKNYLCNDNTRLSAKDLKFSLTPEIEIVNFYIDFSYKRNMSFNIY